MPSRLLLLAVLSLAAAPLALAQPVSLTGLVLDAESDEPLAGVTVLVPGTTLGTATDRDGRFRLFADAATDRLTVSFVGYRSQTVAATPGEEIVVRLEPSLVDLQPVVVSASREEEARTAAPVAIAALSAADLDATKPSALHEALNRVPGVYMADLGNEQHAMSIRQPISYRALFVYLEDGIPIRPVGLFNHNALIEVNMDGVGRVEVIRGPSSSLYGSNAVGGAVNFVTPRPSVAPEARASVRATPDGYGRADLRASATLGQLGLWVGGYGARQRDGIRAHSDFDKASITARADYAFSPRTRLTTTLTASHLDTDTDGALDSTSFAQFGRGGAITSLQTFTYRTVDAARLTSRIAHVWDDRHATDVALFARANQVGQLPHYRIRRDANDPAVASGEVNEDSFRSLGLVAQHQAYLPWRQARLLGGVTLDRSPASYHARYLDIARDPATGRFVGFAERDSLLTDFEVDLLNAAAYVQAEVNTTAALRLVGSLRYDRIGYTFDNHLPPSAFSGAPDGTSAFGRLSPRLGFTVAFTETRGLYGNVSQGFVPPEVGELYRGVTVPTLRPATFTSYEVGGWSAFLDGRLYLDAALYRMDGTDEIIAVTLDDGSRANRNAGATRHEGVEAAATLAPGGGLTLRLSGTAARHTFVRYEVDGVVLDGNEMDLAPGWVANAELAYRPPFLADARAALEWQHVDGYYMDPANTARYGGHDVLNLRLSYGLGDVEAWATVNNLTDALYATVASRSRFGAQYTPGLPRTVSLGVGYRFDAR